MIQMIRRFYVKMGIMTDIDDDMLLVLIDDMKDSYGEWRISEVENAFNLGLKGKLEIDLNLYNKPFNLVFLSKLMSTYREYIRPALNKSNLMLAEKTELTKDEKAKIALDAVLASFESYKSKKVLLNYNNSIYNLIKSYFDYPDKEFEQKAHNRAVLNLEIQKAKKPHALKSIKKQIFNIEIGNDTASVERIICDMKLRKFFSELINHKTGPEPIIRKWIKLGWKLSETTKPDLVKIMKNLR